MASPKIIPKKSVQAAKIPQSADLESGEICINHADKILYAKHPSTGAIQEIGSLSAHSHDELYSLDGVQHVELQNNGSLLVEDGSNPAKTFVFPSVSGTLATLGDITAGQQADWNATSGSAEILNKPTLAAVATSGSYNDLSGVPSLGTAASANSSDFAAAAHTHPLSDLTQSSATTGQVPTWDGAAWVPQAPPSGTNADWSATSGAAEILNKPTLATVATSGSYNDLSGTPSLGTAASANSSDFATAGQGTKADTASQPGHTHAAADISGLAAVAASGSYIDLTNKPTLGTAAATSVTDYATAAQGTKADTASQPGHTHTLSGLTQSSATTGQVATWDGTAWVAQTPSAGGVTSVAGRSGAVTLTISDVANAVGSVITGVANSTQLTNMMQITQAGYNAITPNANTLYVIVG